MITLTQKSSATCLRLIGHWSPTGCSASFNKKLSLNHFTIESVCIIGHKGGQHQSRRWKLLQPNSDSWIWWCISAVLETNWAGNIRCWKCKVKECRSLRIITTTTAAFCYVVAETTLSNVLSWWQLTQKWLYSFQTLYFFKWWQNSLHPVAD